MTVLEDLIRVLDLPDDPALPGFAEAARRAAGRLALLAADEAGLRVALAETAQMLIACMALDSDRPRATLEDLVQDMRAGALEYVALCGGARCDA